MIYQEYDFSAPSWVISLSLETADPDIASDIVSSDVHGVRLVEDSGSSVARDAASSRLAAWQRLLAVVALFAPPLGLAGILTLRAREPGATVSLGHWMFAASAALAFPWYWATFGYTTPAALWALVAVIGAYMGYAVVCESVARPSPWKGRPTIFIWSLAFFLSVASSQVAAALQSSFSGGLDYQTCSGDYVSLSLATLFVFFILGSSGGDIYARKDLFFREMWDEMDSVRPPHDIAGVVDKVYLFLGIAILRVILQPLFFFGGRSFNVLGIYKCFD